VLDQHRADHALRQGAQGPESPRLGCGGLPRNWGKNVTLISSITLGGGIGPSLSMEGSSDGESFGLFLREVLCLTLKRGQIVVMDNLSVHRGAWVRELIEEKGAEVLLLPPYSPNFNPIEEAFSKVKGLLRRAKARTRGALRRNPRTRHLLRMRHDHQDAHRAPS
jgi:transposase